MAPVPVAMSVIVEIQDQAGFRSTVRINAGFTPDITALVADLSTVVRTVFNPGTTTDIVHAVAALTNAKIIRVGLQFDTDWASEPTGEAGSYKYITTKARLHYEDGNGENEFFSVPAPKDALFLTGVGMQTVVDPASALIVGATSLPHFVQALNGLTFGTARGGTWGQLFMGGQLIQGKAPVRRVTQGQ